MFHRTHDTIKGNLTIVFTALAISRTVQNNTALDVGNVIRQLRTQKPTPPETPTIEHTPTRASDSWRNSEARFQSLLPDHQSDERQIIEIINKEL